MLDSLSNQLHDWADAWTGWRRRRRAHAELLSLDDRSLADIGITRSEIPYVLSHTAEVAKRTRSRTAVNHKLPRTA